MPARSPDGTGRPGRVGNSGEVEVAAVAGGLEGAEVLEVGAAVALGEPGEAELADPNRVELAADPFRLGGHALDDPIEVVAGHRPPVRRARPRAAEPAPL